MILNADMNVLDRFIGYFAPSWALQREISRQTLSNIQERGYESAAYGRRTSNWRATSTSPTTEAGQAISILRNRSREMVRNNAWAFRAIGIIANNTVGTGIRPAISATAKKQGDKVKLAWNKWADSTACDFDSKLDFYGLQNLIMRAVAEGGECLIIKKVDKETQSLKIQILEGDYIDQTKHSARQLDNNGEFDFYGVRFNAKGQRIGIWLYDEQPNDFGNHKSTLYSFDDVIHVFETLRAGQARGVPMGAPCFLRLRDLDGYEDAQLLRQKVAACFSIFVQQNATGLPTDNTNEDKYERVEPAMIQYLAPGESVTFGNPPAVEGYEPYTRSILRGVAAGYGITYEALTGDLSNVNFSSGRMGWLEFHRNIHHWQRDILKPALEKVFVWFLGILALSQGVKDNIIAEWTTPRREMIDPTKETNGLIAQIRAGLKSYQEAVRELGYDPEDTLQEQAAFYKLVDTLGLKLVTDLRAQLQPDKAAANE